VTVFVTTHYMDEAEYCDRIALIYRGELIAESTPAGLKAQHMREEVLEVHCERPQDAMTALETLPGVKEVALFGPGLHVVTTSAASLEPVLRAHLAGRGHRLGSLERIAPSLEDVFISLIEAHDRAARPQEEVAR
jgi:ABC-2 type transport system ATP-binding protein